MKLKNIGSKIVNVGPVVLVPGQEENFAQKDVDTPAVKIFCKLGYLAKAGDASVEEAEETKPQPEKTGEGEKPQSGKPAEEGTKKSTGRGKAKEE